MTLDNIEEEINKTYGLAHLEEIDEESDDNNETTESELVNLGDGKTGRFRG